MDWIRSREEEEVETLKMFEKGISSIARTECLRMYSSGYKLPLIEKVERPVSASGHPCPSPAANHFVL